MLFSPMNCDEGAPTKERLIEDVKAAQKGDASAQSRLIRAHQDALFRFCLHLCADPQLAQDLAQDALIRALDQIGKLREPATFPSWLLTTARNLFLDHVKSPRNKGYDELEEGDGSVETQGGALAASADGRDESMHVRQVLQGLEPRDRMILVLVDMEGYSYAETAGIVGISEANVRFRLHHARKEFIKRYRRASA
jgi:RNA polymerase sigma-70 factor (ECF subfamily)